MRQSTEKETKFKEKNSAGKQIQTDGKKKTQTQVCLA